MQYMENPLFIMRLKAIGIRKMRREKSTDLSAERFGIMEN